MVLARSASVSAGGIHREWASPRGSPWARIEITLLIFATIQLFTSIYIYIDRRHDFFFGYLAYAVISWGLMLCRVRYGLVWFALGSLLYCIWLSILTWRAVSSSSWVEMCLDFILAVFELLVLCSAMSRFHEVGGLAPCCGEPDHLEKEAAFRVGVKNNARAVIASGQGGGAAGGQWGTLGGEDEEGGMDEEAEAELYLSGSLLAQAHPTGDGFPVAPQRKSSSSSVSSQPYSQSQSRNAAYIPPQHSSPSSLQQHSHTRPSSSSHSQHPSYPSPSQARPVEEAGFVESSSGFFGSSTVDSSGISSASSSYSHSIGQGPIYGYAAGNRSSAQATPRMPQVLRTHRPSHAASPSDFQSGSFVLSRMPLQHDTMQAQKEQQRLEVQRSNAQTQQMQPTGSMH